jgi:S-adenosylmethionine-diacylgycerolhomoserine-N-methlytransferase
MSDTATKPQGSFFGDLKILWHLMVKRARGKTHQERLESFYHGQASGYDSFRSRMLHGRQELFSAIDVVPDSVWIDFGAGTGENAERLGDKLKSIRKGYLVDLCPSLLEVARQRTHERKWHNIEAVCGDATTYVPPEGAVDLVTFSYSLTMIPDWYLAVDHALRLLKPGGQIAVVDFYVSRKYPAEGLKRHGWFSRTVWPTWFASDNVHLNPDHIPYLQSRFETVLLRESRGKLPYIPFLRVPHYNFIGRKRAA